jgi:hypothetical protein
MVVVAVVLAVVTAVKINKYKQLQKQMAHIFAIICVQLTGKVVLMILRIRHLAPLWHIHRIRSAEKRKFSAPPISPPPPLSPDALRAWFVLSLFDKCAIY